MIDPTIYGLALLGGIILNVMPCVLPVLTMKIFHVVEQAKEAPSVNRKHGVAYTLGIMAFFTLIAAIAVGAKFASQRLIWGQQFQNVYFNAAIVTMVFVFALNALGVFEFTVSTSVDGGDGLKGTFVKGLVAAVMATPCTAPFMGGALAVALKPETAWYHCALIFEVMGFGLALPFLIISFIPAFAKVLPRPGAWMSTFKQVMGFTLLAAAIWFFNGLQALLTPGGTVAFLVFLLGVAFGLFTIGKFAGPEHSAGRNWGVRFASVGVMAGVGFLFLDFSPKEKSAPVAANAEAPVVADGHIQWVPWSDAALKGTLARNRPVFLDFTADWCANCKANEKAVIETEVVRQKLIETQILPMKVDFTEDNEEIEAWIENLGRGGIPIYVVMYPNGDKELLPEVITTDLLTSAFDKVA
ncbi:MAG: thioredoxin family protein, partial [Myxococcota bacterium]